MLRLNLPTRRDFPRLVLALVFACSVAMSAYFIIDQNEQSERWVLHTHHVMDSLEMIMSELKDAETGQRGFLLTGEETYLQPYTEASAHFHETFEKCRSYLADNPNQLDRLYHVQMISDQKLEELRNTIDLRRKKGFALALVVVKSGAGRNMMERIRSMINDMQKEEQDLLERRIASRRRTLKGLGAFISFLILLLLGSVLSLLSQIESRKEAQDELFQAFEKLRVSEERFRLLIEGVKDYALYMLDINGNVTTWTPAAERLQGYKPEDVVGTHFSRFHLADDVAAGKSDRLLKRAAAEGHIEAEGWQIRKDGSSFWAKVLIAALKDKAGTLVGYSKLVRDQTEQMKAGEALRQKEQELIQSRKLEAIGRLAGGVAHDFNNLMTGILGICDELANDATIAGRHEDIQEISKAATRATLLTKQLLAFSRRQIASPIVINVNVIIADLQKMLKRMIREDIELATYLDPDLGNVRADPGQIEQILINMVINAKDAMPQGGKITIETTNVDLSTEYVKRHFEVRPGPYVAIIISDTGTGIDPELQSQVFEPFFTTKEKDKGTGLGLATVYGIVKQNSGDIFLYSHPGKGTTFKIYLPRVAEPAESERRQEPNRTWPGGTETILVVEDEDIVRRVAARALTRQGYNVLQASNGKDALEISASYGKRVDLLLTDVVMPGINGRQLAEMLESTRPDLKVLYVSGYTENIIVNRGMLKPGIHFLEKTFTSEALCRKVREVLDTPLEIAKDLLK